MRADVMGMVGNVTFAWPTAERVSEVGVTWVRTIVYDDGMDDLERGLQSLPAGVAVVAVLNQEIISSSSPHQDWAHLISTFAQRFRGRVAAVECLNEWDPDAQHPAGTGGKWWPAMAVGMALVASPILHRAGIQCLLGSVSGADWPQQLRLAASYLSSAGRALLDGVCLHPYGKSANGFPPSFSFGEINDAVQTAHDISGLPVWVTEFGVKLGDAAGPKQAGESDTDYNTRALAAQNTYLQQAYQLLGNMPPQVLRNACYFAYSDAVGSPAEQGINAFGLRDSTDAARPAWGGLQQVVLQARAAPTTA
jgi:putative glycosyl hydrolase